MVLVDFSHLCHRMLHVSVINRDVPKPKKGEQYKVKDYKGIFLHMIFNNLRYIKKEYEKKYGDVVICIDSRNNWRKKVYPAYKENRAKARGESNIDYKEFFVLLEETISTIKKTFPFKVVEVDYAEADDVIAVLSKREANLGKDVLIISEDKDFKQLLTNNHIKQFKPVEKKFVSVTKEEIEDWIIEHTIKGDESDGVPRIIDETVFTDEFISYLKQNGVFEYEPYKVLELEVGRDLISKYTGVVYKKERFMFKDFIKNLEENLNKNPLYKKHLERNKILVLAENIPVEIEEQINIAYNEAKMNCNQISMLEYFFSNNLTYLASYVQDFLSIQNVVDSEEWF